MILGIESTAHTFGVAVLEGGKILSNVKESYTTESGGIIPIEAAKHHSLIADEVYEKAFDGAGISEDKIKAVAFSQGPGLAPCLLEGIRFAKEVASRLSVPLIPVNHCLAHLEIGKITGCKDPVLLYTSGANTQIIAYASGKYRVFGETLDVGVGNFIDVFGRYLGLGFPAGPEIDKLAEKIKGEVDKENPDYHYIELPYSIKGMDVSFSGILTKLRQMIESGKYKKEDLAFSMQETVFAMLVEASERALAHTGKKELLLGGGVACNSRLQEMCKIMCKERKCKFFCPPASLLTDNAAMIAFTGEIMFNKGIYTKLEDIDEVDILPRQRTDDVEVKWK